MSAVNQRSEAWFRALMEQSPLSTQVFSPDGRTIQVNKAWERMWGITLEHVAEYNVLEDPQLARYGVLEFIRRGFAGEPTAVPAVWYDPNQTLPHPSQRADPRRWVRAFVHPIKDDAGSVTEVVLIHEDMTDQKVAEMESAANAERLRISEERFRLGLSSGAITVFEQDASLRYTWAYPAMTTFRDDAVDPTTEHPLGEDAAVLRQLKREVMSSGHGLRRVVSVSLAEGVRHYDLTVEPRRNQQGEIIGVCGAALDITAQRQSEVELRESEQRFVRFMQHLPGLAWIKDLQGRYRFANQAALSAFGRTSDELLHHTDAELFPPATAAQFQANDLQAMLHPGGLQTVEKLRQPDGIVHHSLVSKFPIPAADGTPAYIGGVAVDITDLMHAEEALRDADRRKNEFLATLAHELRNPLAPIRNSLQLLKMAGDDRATRDQASNIMDRQLQQLVRLVDDLLDVSRITRNRLELRLQRVELSAAVQSAVEASRTFIDSYGHQLNIALGSDPIFLHADFARLAQIISNLLNNAAKYMDRGGQIWLTAEVHGENVVVSVRDAGIGISPEHMPTLFEMFSQVKSALERSEGGLGIGLALVRGLVEMHGGNVSVFSAGLGQGSEFRVTLPRLHEEDDRTQLPENLPTHNEQGRGRVLIVDDNKDGADSMALTLRLTGYETHTVYDGAAAVAAAEWFRPRVVLLDIGLPKLNGYDVAKHIRGQPFGKSITLIAVTGWGQQEDKQRALEAGIDHHMTKPVDYPELAKLLTVAFASV